MIFKTVLALAGFLLAQDSPLLQQFTGILCFSEAAAEESALAYQEGGLDLQDEVVDNLINVRGKCRRFNKLDDLRGYIVYEGARIGDKIVVGLAAGPDGPAEMFGLMNAGEPLATKRGA